MARLSKENVEEKKRMVINIFSCTAQDTKPTEFHPHHSSQPSGTPVPGDPAPSSGLQGARHMWCTDIKAANALLFPFLKKDLLLLTVPKCSPVTFYCKPLEPVLPLPKHFVCKWSRTMLSMPASHRCSFRYSPPSTVTH